MKYVKSHYKSALTYKGVQLILILITSFELQLSEMLSPQRIQIILITRPVLHKNHTQLLLYLAFTN